MFSKKENPGSLFGSRHYHQPLYKDSLIGKTMNEKHSEERGIFDFS